MSVARAPKAALAAGVRLRIDDDDWELSAPSERPLHVLRLLSQDKVEIVKLICAAIENPCERGSLNRSQRFGREN